MIPKQKSPIVAGFGVESVEYHLGGTFRGSYYTLNDNIINGRIRGIGGVVGCNNARTRHNEMIVHIDKKRQALGIDKARDRILVDMAARRELESA
jgi:carbon-monoxide dehydrogenase catalytic subunit